MFRLHGGDARESGHRQSDMDLQLSGGIREGLYEMCIVMKAERREQDHQNIPANINQTIKYKTAPLHVTKTSTCSRIEVSLLLPSRIRGNGNSHDLDRSIVRGSDGADCLE